MKLPAVDGGKSHPKNCNGDGDALSATPAGPYGGSERKHLDGSRERCNCLMGMVHKPSRACEGGHAGVC